MRNITLIVFICAELLLLVSCSYATPDATSTPSLQAKPLPETVASTSSQATLPPAEAVKPVKVLRTNEYSEGVVIDHDGNIYFSHGKSITIVAPSGSNRLWVETGDPNGHKILADGTHLVANGSFQEVLHIVTASFTAGIRSVTLPPATAPLAVQSSTSCS